MKKLLTVLFAAIFSATNAFAAEAITGTWKTIDDETGEAKSLVKIYETDGKIYGRVIRLFKNENAEAKGIKGTPKIIGLDVIWNLKDTGKKFTDGKILDPKKGKIYNSEAWLEDENTLIVRGKIGPFGRNQEWLKVQDINFDEPLIPIIPEKE